MKLTQIEIIIMFLLALKQRIMSKYIHIFCVKGIPYAFIFMLSIYTLYFLKQQQQQQHFFIK